MSERVARAPILVTAEVLAGLQAVRESGESNMFDVGAVACIARRLGHDAAPWGHVGGHGRAR